MRQRFLIITILGILFTFFPLLSNPVKEGSLTDIKIKASLVRVTNIGIFSYSLYDLNGIKTERHFYSGRVSTGVLVDSRGFVLVSKTGIPVGSKKTLDQAELFPAIENQIVESYCQSENIETPDDFSEWKDERGLKINDFRIVNRVILANKTSYPFTLLSSNRLYEDQDLLLLKIDQNNLPFSQIAAREGSYLNDIFYTISGSSNPDLIQKYYSNLLYNYLITQKKIINLFSLSQGDLINWQVIDEKLVTLEVEESGVWFNDKGEIKAFLISTPRQLRVIDYQKIQAEVDSFQVQLSDTGGFNQALNKLQAVLGSGNPNDVQKTLNKMDSHFHDFLDLSNLASLPLDKLGKKMEKDSFFSKDNLKKIVKEYKLYVIVLSSILVLFILFFLIFKIKRQRGAIPDLPDEPLDDSRTELSMAYKQDLKDYIDVMINDEFHNSYSITDGRVKIGRDPASADVIISELIVSKLHCTIQAKEGKYIIIDNNSTNGVYDGSFNKIDEKELEDGEEISLGKKGKVKLIFHTQKLIDSE